MAGLAITLFRLRVTPERWLPKEREIVAGKLIF